MSTSATFIQPSIHQSVHPTICIHPFVYSEDLVKGSGAPEGGAAEGGAPEGGAAEGGGARGRSTRGARSKREEHQRGEEQERGAPEGGAGGRSSREVLTAGAVLTLLTVLLFIWTQKLW